MKRLESKVYNRFDNVIATQKESLEAIGKTILEEQGRDQFVEDALRAQIDQAQATMATVVVKATNAAIENLETVTNSAKLAAEKASNDLEVFKRDDYAPFKQEYAQNQADLDEDFAEIKLMQEALSVS
jgi:uncharacterized membrane protein YccC